MKKRNKQGFTLTELITTITIISIVLGIATAIVISIINNSKEETLAMAKKNILTSARNYTEEYNQDMAWVDNKIDEEKEKYTCVTINELINKGLIDKKIKEQIDSNFVILWKNQNNVITSEEIDETGICIDSNITINKPTKEDYCNQGLIYNKQEQNLIKITNNNIEIKNNIQKNAGTYDVTLSLKKGYYWSDGSITPKTIKCTIKKATPLLLISPQGSPYLPNESITVKVNSDTEGTLSTKSSNDKYIESNTINNKITSNDLNKDKESIKISFIKNDPIEGKVIITLTPEDSQNYNIVSKDFIIKDIEKQTIPIPICKENLYYEGTIQSLIEEPIKGVTLYNYQAKDIGTYPVIAELQYGYIWEDNTTETKTINCTIKNKTYTIVYNGNENTDGLTNNSIHYLNEPKKLNTNGYTKTGYTFTRWNTKKDGTGTSYTNEQEVTNLTLENNATITLYAQWIPNTYKVYYVGNGNNIEDYTNETHCTTDNKCGLDRYAEGSTFNQTTQTFEHNAVHKYNNKFNLIINRFSKQGYTFAGWSTIADEHVEYLDGEEVNNLTTDNNAVINLYARWNPNTYKITYNFNSGIKGANAPTSASYDAPVNISKPTREHKITFDANNTGATLSMTENKATYSFAGWTSTNINITTSKYGHSANDINSLWNSTSSKINATYFKNLTPINNNTVTLKANWNTPSAISLATITKSGYNCNWNIKADGSGMSYYQTTKLIPTSDITLYAICKPNAYNISYELNGGMKENSTPTTANYDTIVNINNPTKSYTILYALNNTNATISTSTQIIPSTFDGWTAQGLDTQNAKYGTSSSNVTSAWDNANTKIKATYFTNLATKTDNNITLTANWTNGTTELASVTKSGYTCTWNTKSDGTGTSYNPNANYTPTANITLYAICKPNKVIFKFNTNGGTIKSQTTTENGSTTFNWSQNTEGTIKLSNTETFWTQSYNATSVNLPNYNNSNYMYITKDGLVAIPSAEWNTKPDGTGTSYSHDATYKASDFCDASQSTCTVTLYVNWAKIMYLCVSDSSTSWAEGGTTYMRPKAGFTITGHVLITGTPVIVFGTATEDSRFYHIELPEAYRGDDYVYLWGQYYMENATNLYRGYIYKGCLLPNPISKDNYCSPSVCTG